MNKAISYLLPSDSKNKAEQATDAPIAGFHPLIILIKYTIYFLSKIFKFT